MKKSVFLKMMTAMTLFFMLLCAVFYALVSGSFEATYRAHQEKQLLESLKTAGEALEAGGLDSPAFLEQMQQFEQAGMSLEIYEVQEIEKERQIQGSSENAEQKGRGRAERMDERKAGRHNESRKESCRSQVNLQPDGTVFETAGKSGGHELRWLTARYTLADGTVLAGFVPFYAMDTVIVLVRRFLILFSVGIFVCSVIFSFFFARSLTRPIKALNAMAQAMGELDFSRRYEGHSQDEIGELGRTLNAISQKLSETIQQLDQELGKERTLEKMRHAFTAQISHEFQTPLAVIRSYAEALEDGLAETPKEAQAYYRTIGEEAARISQMASELLNLAQIESGAAPVRPQQMALVPQIKAIVDRFQKTCPKIRVVLLNEMLPDQSVWIDLDALQQMLYNLLSNAQKHLADGAEVIEVRVSAGSGDWCLSVYNPGRLLSEAELSGMFERFYKGDHGKAGTGLGLAIVRGLAEAHGGTVFAENDVDGVRAGIRMPFTRMSEAGQKR